MEESQGCLRYTNGSRELNVETAGQGGEALTRGVMTVSGSGDGGNPGAGQVQYWILVVFLRYAMCIVGCGDSREMPVVWSRGGGRWK